MSVLPSQIWNVPVLQFYLLIDFEELVGAGGFL